MEVGHYVFLDALASLVRCASLDFKLSVSQSVTFFLQLAHLRVFQIIFSASEANGLDAKLNRAFDPTQIGIFVS